MAALIFYASLVLIVALAAYFKYIFRLRRKGEPSIVPGHFLWGNGKEFAEFAEDAVKFIHKAQAKFGDIFSIRLLHQHLSIINDPHTYERMCKEKAFDFDPIQKQVNHNVFGFELVNAPEMLKEAGKKVKGRHMNSGMQSFSKHLTEAFQHLDASTGSDDHFAQDGLRSMASRTMFQAIFRTIFGRGKTGDVFEPITVYKQFDAFHKYFNYLWLGLPIKLFPNACKALDILIQQPSSEEIMSRGDVSEYIKFSTQYIKAHGQSETDIIGHNLVYLHVNYNTFRVTYWLIYYLTQHPEAYHALKQEVEQAMADKAEYSETDDPVKFDQEDVDRLPILDSFVKETIRNSSGVFMVRAIIKDTSFEMDNGDFFNLREGDRVAMYPPALHKDPEIFENPSEFKYDRFVDAKFYKRGKEVKNPLLGFGSICPGKKMAITQAKWYTLNLINSYDFHLVEGAKCQPDSNYHGHEILPPTNDVDILFKRRENVRSMEFV